MATIDWYLSPVDVKDAHVLTRTVERRINEPEVYNVPFAPLVATYSRKVKQRVRHLDAAGLAAFRADNADTPIVTSGGDLVELYMELFLISEKDVLKESDMVQLRSPDDEVAFFSVIKWTYFRLTTTKNRGKQDVDSDKGP